MILLYMNIILSVILLSIIEITAIAFVKLYNTTSDITNLIVAGLFFFLIAIVWSFASRTNFLAYINAYWNALSTILVVILGFYFGEILTMTNIFGIVIVIVGLILMNI